MSTEKIKSEVAELASASKRMTDTIPDKQLQVLSLEMDEDSGGDPYNRTGQFCIVDRRKQEH